MTSQLKIPAMGESITEAQIGEWRKAENDSVASGEDVVSIESEKATLELPAPAAGRLARILKCKGETARVGEVIAEIEVGAEAKPNGQQQRQPNGEDKPAPEQPAAPTAQPPTENPAARETPAPRQQETPAPPKREVSKPAKTAPPPARDLTGAPPGDQEATVAEAPTAPKPNEPATAPSGGREEEVVPMSPLRRTVARRLVEAQRNAALLSTFNESDMSAVLALRRDCGEAFQKRHGVKLGLMSFFVKASVDALKHVPQLNAEIRQNDIVFRNYYDICIAISSGRGLVTPVLRNAERLGFAEIEKAIGDLAQRADHGSLAPDELAGGTFTISNGGVFGSLLSTPIVNPPQSGILGMHAIQDRPIALASSVVIRPMMYLALSYDHRVVDGRDAVLFLKRIKEAVENPARMLIEA